MSIVKLALMVVVAVIIGVVLIVSAVSLTPINLRIGHSFQMGLEINPEQIIIAEPTSSTTRL